MLALMRETSKLIALGRSAPVVKNEIRVYSPSAEGLMWFSVGLFPRLPPTLPTHVNDILLVEFRKYRSIWVDDG
jgi:hypothetical protein